MEQAQQRQDRVSKNEVAKILSQAAEQAYKESRVT